MLNYKVIAVVVLVLLCLFDVLCKNENEIEAKVGDDVRNNLHTAVEVEIPKIEFGSLSETQPQKNETDVIWLDNFDKAKSYMESKGELDGNIHFGKSGSSVKAGFKKRRCCWRRRS